MGAYTHLARAVALAAVVAAGQPARALVPSDAAPNPDARPPRNVVVLLDVSTSMDDLFPEVQAALEDFITSLRGGDHLSLIAFSDGVRIVTSQAIETAADQASLVDTVRGLHPVGRYTDVTTALNRGMSHLRRVSEAGDFGRVQYLLLVTDGRHNPPHPERAPSFSDILTRYERARPGETWFLHYIALGPIRDDPTVEFVAAAGGRTSWLRDVDRHAVARSLAQLDLPFPIVIRDLYGDVRQESADGTVRPARIGTVLATGDTLHTGRHGYAVMHFGRFGVVGVEGDSVVGIEQALHRPVTNAFEVALWVPKGRLISSIDRTQGNITFQVNSPQADTVVAGTNFLAEVDPLTQGTTIAVIEGKVQVEARGSEETLWVPAGTMTQADAAGALSNLAPLAEWMVELWGTWRRALFAREELKDVVSYFAAVNWRRRTLEIGPLRPGLPLVNRMRGYLGPIDLTQVTPVIEQATYPPEIDLSVAVEPAPYARDPGEVVVVFTTKVDTEWEIEYSTAYRALVRLAGPGVAEDLQFVTPVTFQTLELVVDHVQAQRRPRVGTTVGARRRQEQGSGWLWWVPLGIGLGLLAFSLARNIRMGPRRRRPQWRRFLWRWTTRSAIPNGHLLQREKPASTSWSRVLVNLEQLCQDNGRSMVSIGLSRDNILVLPDKDLSLHHAEIHATGSRIRPRVTLRRLGDASVGIDGRPATEQEIELRNGTWIQFGQFAFTYHAPGHETAVEVGLSNGAKMRGALHVWDARHRVVAVVRGQEADAPHFQLLFSEVEYVAFGEEADAASSSPDQQTRRTMRRWETHGASARVTLKSGSTFLGSVPANYDADQEFFYFYPETGTDVDFMLIAQAHVADLKLAKARPTE